MRLGVEPLRVEAIETGTRAASCRGPREVSCTPYDC